MDRTTRHAARIAVALLSLLALGRAAAEEPAAALAAARTAFDEARAGRDGAAARARDLFRALAEREPGNPLFLAYQGSSAAMVGRDAWAPWTKMRQTEAGLGLLDKALALLGPEHERALPGGTPVALETRLVASATFLRLPGLFNRREAGRMVLRDAFASQAFEAAPAPIRAQLHLQAAFLARADEKQADEVTALRSAVAAGSNDQFAEQARKRLAELGQ